MFHARLLGLIATALLLPACGGEDNSPGQSLNASVLVNWDANKEIDVNATGGGYRVYYSTGPTRSLTNTGMVDVPYVSGPLAPTSATLVLPSGQYAIQVVAYSARNPEGSAASEAFTLSVPFQ